MDSNNSHVNAQQFCLYIVATPIGNLADITLRALEVLKSVDLIAAEDTRHSKKLLSHYGIITPLISLHDYNEEKRTAVLLQYLHQGKSVALIADAGTPLISDPGYRLVSQARAAGVKVVPVPGACAAIAALSASGLPTDSFIFAGFLSPKKTALRNYLATLATEEKTLIFYESPHRLMQFIDALLEVFGEKRYVVIAKELTKTFETIYGAPLADLKTWLNADTNRQKGEFVILVQGLVKQKIDKTEIMISDNAKHILQTLAAEMSYKQAVALTAKITGENKRAIYQSCLPNHHDNDVNE